MSAATPGDLERLLSLLADRSTQGLSAAELAESERLLGLFEELDESALDRAAAGIELALLGTRRVPPPPALRLKLETEAKQLVPARAAETADAAAAAADAPRAGEATPGSRFLDGPRIRWALGAAGVAGVVIAALAFWL